MADENLEKLRKDYEDLFGKKPFNGWKSEQLQKKIDAMLNGSDDTDADGDATAAEPTATPADPYPTQADLDAMRAGTFDHYKTR